MQRVLVLPDTSVYPPRFILGYEYALADTFRVIRSVRDAIPDVLNSAGRVVPEEMIIDTRSTALGGPLGAARDNTNFRRQSFPNFGRWIYTTPTSPATANNVLNWAQYDASITPGKKKVNSRTLTGTHSIVAVSPAMDCVITKVVSNSNLFITMINPSGSTDILTFANS